MEKKRIGIRFDKNLLGEVDTFVVRLVPKKNRTEFLQQAAKNELRREKARLKRKRNEHSAN